MNWLGLEVQKFVTDRDTVLDIGCGIMQASDDLSCKIIVGVDIWKPYLEKIKNLWPVMQMDVTKELECFLDNSFDVVICLDLLEHLEAVDVSYVLTSLTRICRKRAIIFTPATFRTNEEAVPNAWDLGHNDYQYHKCLVSKETLEQHGFNTFISNPDRAHLAIFEKSIIGTNQNK